MSILFASDTLQAILFPFCLFLYPVFVIGPLLLIALIFLSFQMEKRWARIALHFPIFFIITIMALDCYLVWPLDLLPYRKDIVIETVTVGDYTVSIAQSSGYNTYFLVTNPDGETTRCTIQVDDTKLWHVDTIKKDNKIYFKSYLFDGSPYIDLDKMILHTGRHNFKIGIDHLFEENRKSGWVT